MKKLIARSMLAAALVPMLWIAPTIAAPVTWTLSAELVSGTWLGTFDYDADTEALTNISVDSTFLEASGSSHEFTFGSGDGSDFLFATDDPTTDGSGMLWRTTSALTNAGGSIDIVPSSIWGERADCQNPTCTVGTPFTNVVSGTVSSVPLPAAAWLFGSALLGLGALKRRKA